ncbi:MAG: SH3 domain-containing protein [Deltaproteobacteria bacterium]|nr:SH3 domain-containing protein [Deltaproteobacteria bacterium]
MRAEASSRAPVAATITNGTTVIVGERRGRWWRITAPAGQAGWVWAPNLAQRCP